MLFSICSRVTITLFRVINAKLWLKKIAGFKTKNNEESILLLNINLLWLQSDLRLQANGCSYKMLAATYSGQSTVWSSFETLIQ